MQKQYLPIDVLPHRPPMILIDRVIDYDLTAHTLCAGITIQQDDLFFDKSLNGVPQYVALEYMAQTIGCLVGIFDRQENRPPKVGFVLGSRKIEQFADCFELGNSYQIQIKEVFLDQNLASFDCVILDENDTIVSQGILNAYRPDDITDFLKGYQ